MTHKKKGFLHEWDVNCAPEVNEWNKAQELGYNGNEGEKGRGEKIRLNFEPYDILLLALHPLSLS